MLGLLLRQQAVWPLSHELKATDRQPTCPTFVTRRQPELSSRIPVARMDNCPPRHQPFALSDSLGPVDATTKTHAFEHGGSLPAALTSQNRTSTLTRSFSYPATLSVPPNPVFLRWKSSRRWGSRDMTAGSISALPSFSGGVVRDSAVKDDKLSTGSSHKRSVGGEAIRQQCTLFAVAEPANGQDDEQDVSQLSSSSDAMGCESKGDEELELSVTSYNILAPCYKRINSKGDRESEIRESWWTRNHMICELLLEKRSSIICLQEFWLANPELVQLYEAELAAAGYETFKLGRTNNRGDGLLTAISKDRFAVVDKQDILFLDCGDRVAQLFRVKCEGLGSGLRAGVGDEKQECPMEFLLVNTHLLFPHNANSTLIRLRQAYKILEFLEGYKMENNLGPIPIVLCGDWNGSKRGQVYRFMRSQGFVSSFDMARQHDDGVQQWISHRNHHGMLCGVDFIWLLNPRSQTQPLTADWKAAVFSMIKTRLFENGLQEHDAFAFFKERDGSHRGADGRHFITLADFKRAVDELGLTGENSVGLTTHEIEELMAAADVDGNGVMDYEEFKTVFQFASMDDAYMKIREATGIVEGDWTPPASPKAKALHALRRGSGDDAPVAVAAASADGGAMGVLVAGASQAAAALTQADPGLISEGTASTAVQSELPAADLNLETVSGAGAVARASAGAGSEAMEAPSLRAGVVTRAKRVVETPIAVATQVGDRAAAPMAVVTRQDRTVMAGKDVGQRAGQLTNNDRSGWLGAEAAELEFVVKEAYLDPPEMAEGEWPETYTLSDHALITSVFRPHNRWGGAGWA